VHAVKVVNEGLHGLEYIVFRGFLLQDLADHLAHAAVKVGKALPPEHVVLVALQDNRRLGRRRGNALWRPDVAVAGVEALPEQAGQVDLKAVQGLAVVVKIVDVEIALHVLVISGIGFLMRYLKVI